MVAIQPKSSPGSPARRVPPGSRRQRLSQGQGAAPSRGLRSNSLRQPRPARCLRDRCRSVGCRLDRGSRLAECAQFRRDRGRSTRCGPRAPGSAGICSVAPKWSPGPQPRGIVPVGCSDRLSWPRLGRGRRARRDLPGFGDRLSKLALRVGRNRARQSVQCRSRCSRRRGRRSAVGRASTNRTPRIQLDAAVPRRPRPPIRIGPVLPRAFVASETLPPRGGSRRRSRAPHSPRTVPTGRSSAPGEQAAWRGRCRDRQPGGISRPLSCRPCQMDQPPGRREPARVPPGIISRSRWVEHDSSLRQLPFQQLVAATWTSSPGDVTQARWDTGWLSPGRRPDNAPSSPGSARVRELGDARRAGMPASTFSEQHRAV